MLAFRVGPLSAGRREGITPVCTRPQPRQLAALGTVLCLYRPQHGSELSGWAQAVRVETHVGVECDGLRESLVFFDCEGHCCWHLWLLPDTDFVAWDRLAASLPTREPTVVQAGIGERLWQRLARRLTGENWRACAIRLHALPQPFEAPKLAASVAPLSTLGAATARDIARAEGAEMEHLGDDCCCALASLASIHGHAADKSQRQVLIPLSTGGNRKSAQMPGYP